MELFDIPQAAGRSPKRSEISSESAIPWELPALATASRTTKFAANEEQYSATVYVYPPDSRAEDASLEGAKAAIVASLKSVPLAQSWSEGPFRAGKEPVLVGEKAFYKIGIGPDSSQTNLYYFDTGKWVVKVRLSAQKTVKGTFQALDTFVRDLPWDSLGLTAESCTGSACRMDRAIAMHGMIPSRFPSCWWVEAEGSIPARIAGM